MSFVDEKSGEIKGFQKILKVTKPDFRMRDAELMVRYFAFINFLPSYKGNLKEFLDSTCKTLNRQWAAQQQVIEAQTASLEEAFELTFSIFGEKNAFRKWDTVEHEYETRFNRAVFDVMMFFFSQQGIRKRIHGFEKQIEADFKRACEDGAFIRAIESTTKSMESTATRLNIWGKALNKRLKLKMAVPHLTDAGIVVG